MRKLLVLAVVAAFAFVSTTASAAILDGNGSTLWTKIAALTTSTVHGNPAAKAAVTLSGGIGTESIAITGGTTVFGTIANTPGTAIFTGVPNLTDLFLTVQNGAGTFATGFGTAATFQGSTLCPGGCFGGVAPLAGDQVLEILGFLSIEVPLSSIGAGGQKTSVVGLLTAKIYVDGAAWITSGVTITGVAGNVISITKNFNGRINMTGAGFTLSPTVNESTQLVTENGATKFKLSGTNMLSGTGAGSVTLVSPVYVDSTEATGGTPIPTLAIQKLVFVPEPGTMLLLGSAVAGLVLVGRKRMKS